MLNLSSIPAYYSVSLFPTSCYTHNQYKLITMQKKKLDLNNLLAKYEGVSSSHNSRFVETVREPHIEEEFYQNKNYNPEPIQSQHQTQPQFNSIRRDNPPSSTTTSFRGNFVMSKSQVQQFLLSIKEELRSEERGVAQQNQNALRQLHQNFQRSHERLKREILELLERTFYENEKNIKEELAKQSKVEPPEFTAVYRRIHSVDEDINRLLNLLKGNDYRKAIAEVVTRDFNLEMTQLKTNITAAKTSYLQSLGEVEPDRSRIQAIKDNVLKLFFIRKRDPQPQPQMQVRPQEDSGIFSIFKDKTQVQNNESQGQSRARKSFFNFGE